MYPPTLYRDRESAAGDAEIALLKAPAAIRADKSELGSRDGEFNCLGLSEIKRYFFESPEALDIGDY